jgi:xanthine dehydrogenase iron-sulfur cluster and FAD-binding subunit A
MTQNVAFTVNGNSVSVAVAHDQTPKALLDGNPSPSRAEIARALDDNLCRCGTHNRILRAVEKAAARLRDERRA